MSAAVLPHPGAVSGTGVCGEGGASAASPFSLIDLLLPAPPSANALFRNKPGVGRVKTKTYEDWRGEAGWRLRLQKPGGIKGHVLIIMGVERTSALADIDNRVKATFDLLVEHQVIEDDRFVVGFATAWSPSRDAMMRVVVMPAASTAVRFQLAPDGAHGGWFIEAPQSEGAI